MKREINASLFECLSEIETSGGDPLMIAFVTHDGKVGMLSPDECILRDNQQIYALIGMMEKYKLQLIVDIENNSIRGKHDEELDAGGPPQ